MTNGYDEAVQWLAENAPDWRLVHADTTLHAGSYVGMPTERRVSVRLERFTLPDDVRLTGDGATILEAAQNAIGALR